MKGAPAAGLLGLLGLLLCAVTAGPVFGQRAAAPGLPVLRLVAVDLAGGGVPGGEARLWSDALLELWEQRYGSWAQLRPAGGAEGAAETWPGVTVLAERIQAGLAVRVTLRTPAGAAASSRVTVWADDPQAAAQAAAGELAFLLAEGSGFPPPREPAPRLSAAVALDSLGLLRGGPAAPAQALGLAADPEGVRVLFAERYLSLGPSLDLTERSTADLLFAPPFPEGFAPAVLSSTALGEPAVYEASTGALLVYPAGGGDAQRLDSGVVQPTHAGPLAGGSLAAVQGRALLLLHRRGSRLQKTQLPLPSGLITAAATERPGALWLYDLGERRIRLLDGSGRELGSIKPLLSPRDLALPQVLRVMPDGGFLLGGTGELWCFAPDGLCRWRLNELGGAPRESLPAYYSAVPAAGPEGAPGGLYLLDPLGRRLFRFAQAPLGGQQEREPTGAAQQDSNTGRGLEERLADGYERLAADPDSRAELIGLCLREDLLLQAHYLFTLGPSGAEAARGVEGRLLEKQARRLAELAAHREGQLRLPEAERAYNAALGLLRELRGLDPMDRRFPKAIGELTEARNAVRETLVAEPLLEADARQGAPLTVARSEATGEAQLRLALRNPSPRSLPAATLDAALAVPPGGPAPLSSRWSGSLEHLAPGGRQTLLMGLSLPPGFPAEDLDLELHVLLRFGQGTRAASQHLAFRVWLPAQAGDGSPDAGAPQTRSGGPSHDGPAPGIVTDIQ